MRHEAGWTWDWLVFRSEERVFCYALARALETGQMRLTAQYNVSLWLAGLCSRPSELAKYPQVRPPCDSLQVSGCCFDVVILLRLAVPLFPLLQRRSVRVLEFLALRLSRLSSRARLSLPRVWDCSLLTLAPWRTRQSNHVMSQGTLWDEQVCNVHLGFLGSNLNTTVIPAGKEKQPRARSAPFPYRIV